MHTVTTSSHLPALMEPQEREAIGHDLESTPHDVVNLLIGKQLSSAAGSGRSTSCSTSSSIRGVTSPTCSPNGRSHWGTCGMGRRKLALRALRPLQA